MIPGGIGPADFSDVLPSGNGGIMYDAFKAMGGGMMKAGNSMLKMAVSFWGMCCEAGVKYLKVNPKGTNAYTTVSGTIFSVFLDPYIIIFKTGRSDGRYDVHIGV